MVSPDFDAARQGGINTLGVSRTMRREFEPETQRVSRNGAAKTQLGVIKAIVSGNTGDVASWYRATAILRVALEAYPV